MPLRPWHSLVSPVTSALLLFSLSLAPFVRSANAQYPGALAGTVRDAITHEPVEDVLVEVLGAGFMVLSDGRGVFRLSGLEPGPRTVRFSRLGYEPQLKEVEIRNGQTVWLTVDLGASPLRLDEIHAQLTTDGQAAAARPGLYSISRAEIEASGAATAGDLLDGRAGLVIHRRGPLGPQSLSIRGSEANQVLVLLDGVPLTDPLTGRADLSAVPASRIDSITIVKGSSSARYGAGAAAGAVLIASRAETPPLALGASSGSLGTWSVGAETGGDLGKLSWSAGGRFRSADGDFQYESPELVGGGIATRINNELSETSLSGSLAGSLGGGRLGLRAGIEILDRGIPGPSYAPTPSAAEELKRSSGQVSWERRGGRSVTTAALYGLGQQTRFSDPDPPLGAAYATGTEMRVLGARLSNQVRLNEVVRALSTHVEVRRQDYESSEFVESAPAGRLDFGVGASAELALADSAPAPRLVAAVRLDRDGLADAWQTSHELTMTARLGPTSLHARHATSFRPPTFGDQFFREGVLVQPNPNLRAERVPHDLGVGASLDGRLGAGIIGRLAVEAFAADVKDMIIWAPDFRFVWSPRNFDVRRRGVDAEAELQITRPALGLRAAYSLARVTYDRPGDDTVQVMYRPRHSGSLAATWRPVGWELAVAARYIGTRYPVPAPVNALDPYWTFDLRLRHTLRAGNWQLTPLLTIERLFDNTDSLIFGYPEPGRLIRLELAVRPG